MRQSSLRHLRFRLPIMALCSALALSVTNTTAAESYLPPTLPLLTERERQPDFPCKTETVMD